MKNGELIIHANGVNHWVKIAGVEHQTTPLFAIHGGPGGNQWILQNTGGRNLEEVATIVYIEQRGCGRSEDPSDPNAYSIEWLINDIEEIRKALNLERIIPLGHSFGGEIALEYTIRYPENVEKLILEAPTMGDWDRLAINQIFTFTALTEGDTRSQVRSLLNEGAPYVGRNSKAWSLVEQDIIKKFSVYKDQSDARLWEISTDDAPRNGNQNMRQAIHKNIDSNLIERVKSIEVPVLIMAGLYDSNTGITMARDILRNLQKGQLEIFMESGHYIHLEEPEKMTSLIKSFMDN